ncbi:uncharacterized protein LOC117168978 [Belonocnema kinseyi]|uniref:uncharacterized protein LOC117168978 n=1 Tax=Belonocnema kinseyi TaxID=2817044 RepID=UPI00143D4522|nr:uncharacterized protein LOC117168978 [Belonocnema kinseyi]
MSTKNNLCLLPLLLTFVFWLLAILLININYANSMDVRPKMYRYCWTKDRLIASEEIDEYLLVDGELNSTILLECHFCKKKYNYQPKIWYYQDRYQYLPEKEVDLGMDNNISFSKIHVTPKFSLVIKNLNLEDAGIYRCRGKEGLNSENKFNYRLEPVFNKMIEITEERGNLSDWQTYHDTQLAPVTMRFAMSRILEMALIREAGIALELISEWGPWSPCRERCKFGKGFRTRRGFCRIKININKTASTGKVDNSSIVNFFLKFPLLPCRAIILENYTEIINATRYLPEFILEEKCNGCKKVKKAKGHKFKYKRKYVLAKGAHLTISCPEYNMSSLETEVVWRKNALLLEKGKGRSFRKKDPEPRVLVDTFSTLNLIDVSEYEQGNYTCYVNNVRMMQVKIVVYPKLRFFTQAFLRHLGYLGIILLIASFFYCGGLVVVFRQRDKFKITDYKEIATYNND